MPIYLHRKIHEFFGNILIGSFEIAHKVASKGSILVGKQGVGHPFLPRTTRAADSVSVCVDVTSHVVIDNGADGWDVQATGYRTYT